MSIQSINNKNTSGYNTPDSEPESFVDIHPTAQRRPYTLTVQSENTLYSDEHITSKYVNRGAAATVVDGQLRVTPTAQVYEFQTKRAVGKTGLVSHFSRTFPIRPVY